MDLPKRPSSLYYFKAGKFVLTRFFIDEFIHRKVIGLITSPYNKYESNNNPKCQQQCISGAFTSLQHILFQRNAHKIQLVYNEVFTEIDRNISFLKRRNIIMTTSLSTKWLCCYKFYVCYCSVETSNYTVIPNVDYYHWPKQYHAIKINY